MSLRSHPYPQSSQRSSAHLNPELMATLCTSCQRLHAFLRGKNLDIADFRVIFQHWPKAVSSYLEGLEIDALERLLR